MKRVLTCILLSLLAVCALAQIRQTAGIDTGWSFRPEGESEWCDVVLPHDWEVDHPETAVAWYRRTLSVDLEDAGRRIGLLLDGVSGTYEIFCNGFKAGQCIEPLRSEFHDLTSYLIPGSDNEITVRVAAPREPSSFYRGAGICRSARIVKTSNIFIPQFSTRIDCNFGVIDVRTRVENRNPLWDDAVPVTVRMKISDETGKVVSESSPIEMKPRAMETIDIERVLKLPIPHMWDLDDRYMYTLHTEVYSGEVLMDDETIRFGVRDVEMEAGRGLVFNNRKVLLHGVNVLPDHAGVGAAIPEALWRYRLAKLQSIGVNAIRCPAGTADPVMLSLCDELGILVLVEASRAGADPQNLDNYRRLVERDFNHPCVILWGLGEIDAELASDRRGRELVHAMSMYSHLLDYRRKTVYTTLSQSWEAAGAADVLGYSAMRGTNPVGIHSQHPAWKFVGTAESIDNIEEANSFIDSKTWDAGVFLWKGFDGKGDDSGVLDYCGNFKDEAFLLQALWTWTAVLHVMPPVGGKINVYTNCDRLELSVDGKKLSKPTTSSPGHRTWSYYGRNPHKIEAKGSYQGRSYIPRVNVADTWPMQFKKTVLVPSKSILLADSMDIMVVDIYTDSEEFVLKLSGPADIIGWGNGDPAFSGPRRPTPGAASGKLSIKSYGKRAQVLIRGRAGQRGPVTVQAAGAKITFDSY